jgi:hypothetical protein
MRGGMIGIKGMRRHQSPKKNFLPGKIFVADAARNGL